uniref:Thiosulfate sulfurtransferase, mitochondrial n=1 Tax=Cacopsylla melanoneura TaxID=428564 RepID=A0A8D9B0L7_9HEMI
MTTAPDPYCHPSTLINIPQIQLYDFEQHLNNNTACIIDVREPKELQETGRIPNSVNIPLGEVREAFELSPAQFQQKYKYSKPSPDKTLVLTCRSGKRSQIACEVLHKQGYERVINYCEGWLGWEQKLKQEQQEQQKQ